MVNKMHLTNAEIERLVLIIEEAGEVVQAATKVLRHGYECYSPFDEKKRTNRFLLECELADLLGVIDFAVENKDIDIAVINDYKEHKMANAYEYLHYQKKLINENN